MLRKAKERAIVKNLEFSIDSNFMRELINRSELKCEITKITFDLTHKKREKRANFSRRPFAPSLDRIDSSKGYTKKNTRLVCCAVNYAMSDWGLDVFLRVARGALGIEQEKTKSYGNKILGLSGVSKHKTKNGVIRFASRYRTSQHNIYLGTFATEYEAHIKTQEAKEAVRNGEDIMSFRARQKTSQPNLIKLLETTLTNVE